MSCNAWFTSRIRPSMSAMPMPIAASVNIARNRASDARNAASAWSRASSTAARIASCSASVRSRSARAYPAANAPCNAASRERISSSGWMPSSPSRSSPSSCTVRPSVSVPVKWASTRRAPIS
jgi:hypothetical protein